MAKNKKKNNLSKRANKKGSNALVFSVVIITLGIGAIVYLVLSDNSPDDMSVEKTDNNKIHTLSGIGLEKESDPKEGTSA